ncbi:hypothetical protein EGJ22_06370 [Pseudomonas sp. p99-361]|uniref:Uncharacterized protein n=1 Tax=Pseudomonas juntendi TaxID=2666183 RepID=A0A7W2QU49_9PSED|nr:MULTISPECIES: hypothetical protein [Pseudomonas]OAK53318.1 hypothetical protein A3K88_07565 [Pseudomonas putida]PPB16767.1 hypothetical protein HV87_19750 [Pseudomonas aeruginosa]MBA6142902.1 hypothetical protein [Pseudomonas juntendi]MCL8329424.1 hypothetical protein [Pseudomonas juntendi]MDM1714185.1 hypothetical protein [Pseudomonas sp. 165]
MLKWLSSISRDFRIHLDWPRFEELERYRYVTEAYDQFPTQVMEADLAERLKRVQDEAAAKFNADRDRLEGAVAALQPKVTDAKRLVSLFQRDYRAELEALYAEKDRLRGEMQLTREKKSSEYDSIEELHEEKKDLYKKRHELQDEINSWYAQANRSRVLLGKKNREIPKYSIFGISQNSLQSAKNDRDVVIKKIKRVKEEIDEANSDIYALNKALEQMGEKFGQTKQRIVDTKRDRTEFFDLRESGKTLKALKSDQDDLACELARLRTSAVSLEEERTYFIRDAENGYGVQALRTELNNRIETRVAHLRAYDLPEQQMQRKLRHREQWLREHSK